MPRTTKTQRTAMFQALATGILADFPASATFVVFGQEYVRDELAAVFAECVAASARTQNAKVAWLLAAQAEAELHEKAEDVRQGVKLAFEARLGPKSPTLRRYGMQPRRPGKKSVAIKLAAAERSRKTRADLGTMGSRQRKKARAKLKG